MEEGVVKCRGESRFNEDGSVHWLGHAETDPR